MNKNEIIIIIVNFLNFFLMYLIFKITQYKGNIRIHVKNRGISKVLMGILIIIYVALILIRSTNAYVLMSLITMLSFIVYINVIAPHAVGIGYEFIYYSNNRIYGRFFIKKIRIDELKNAKLIINKEKDYVRLEVLGTEVYQIYRLDDLEEIKKALEGKISEIEDKSKELWLELIELV